MLARVLVVDDDEVMRTFVVNSLRDVYKRQAWGLGFAGILALLGIGFSLASSPLRWVSAGVAGAAAVAAFALPFKLNILLAIAAAVAMCLMIEARHER